MFNSYGCTAKDNRAVIILSKGRLTLVTNNNAVMQEGWTDNRTHPCTNLCRGRSSVSTHKVGPPVKGQTKAKDRQSGYYSHITP